MSGDRPTGTADLVKFEIDPSSGVIFLKNTPVDRVDLDTILIFTTQCPEKVSDPALEKV